MRKQMPRLLRRLIVSLRSIVLARWERLQSRLTRPSRTASRESWSEKSSRLPNNHNAMNHAPLNQKKVEEVNQLVATLSPHISKLVILLREANVHEFEIGINNGADRLVWMNPEAVRPSPNQAQITDELTAMLDMQYHPGILGGFTFMGMMWNPNRVMAEGIAKKVSEYRARDRKQVEGQIQALLLAFKEGS